MFELVVSIALGVSLAATCGLRAFLPLFVAGTFARFDVISLGETFAWLESTPALVALFVAVVAEVAGDKIPALDHALDAVQTPVRTVAGMVVAAAVAGDLPGWATALFAIVAGGGAAASVHTTKSLVRLGSSATTAGAANPFISLLEDAVALVASVLSVLLWIVAMVVAALVLLFVALAIRTLIRKRRERRAAVLAPAAG